MIHFTYYGKFLLKIYLYLEYINFDWATMSSLSLHHDFVSMMMIREYFFEIIFKSIWFNYLDHISIEMNCLIFFKFRTRSHLYDRSNLNSHFLKIFEHVGCFHVKDRHFSNFIIRTFISTYPSKAVPLFQGISYLF